MKKFLLAGLVTALTVLTTTSPGFSQKASRSFIYESSVPVRPNDVFGLNISSVNTKAMRGFRKAFPTVEGENWFRMRDGYTAEFVSGDIKYRVDYDFKGRWLGTVREYKEEKLDRDVRAIIKSAYFDYNIYWVKEITVSTGFDKPFYFVHIEDDRSFKNLCVYNDDMKVLEELKKSIR